jgi:hypothetical protein
MSRKKKENPIVLIVFQALGIILALFMLLASVLIWGGWIVCEILYGSHARSPQAEEFQLGEDEFAELASCTRHIKETDERLREIEEEGQSLRRRRDGLFHAGSVLGSKLNKEIAELMVSLSHAKADQRELRSLPAERLREWSVPLARLIAFRWSVAIYVLTVVYSVIVKPSATTSIHNVIRGPLVNYIQDLHQPIYGILTLASITAVCAGVTAYFIYSKFLYSHYAGQLERM